MSHGWVTTILSNSFVYLPLLLPQLMQQRSGRTRYPWNQAPCPSTISALFCRAFGNLCWSAAVFFLIVVTKANGYAKMLPLKTVRRTAALTEWMCLKKFRTRSLFQTLKGEIWWRIFFLLISNKIARHRYTWIIDLSVNVFSLLSIYLTHDCNVTYKAQPAQPLFKTDHNTICLL